MQWDCCNFFYTTAYLYILLEVVVANVVQVQVKVDVLGRRWANGCLLAVHTPGHVGYL